MDEMNFRKWLSSQQISSKIQTDLVSRTKRVERTLKNCDIDEQYRNDKCTYLLSLFENRGINDNMKSIGEVDLPIGKHQLYVLKSALKKYIEYIEETR